MPETPAETSAAPDAPVVSVIVPNYNHARYLRQRVDSILNQTFADFELILLDDCSTDDSRAVLESYAADPRVRMVFNDTNSGSPFIQWNRGVGLARGRHVWIAESDDYADPRLLERLTGILESKPDVTVAYCRSRRVTGDGEVRGFADDYLDSIAPGRWAGDFDADGAGEVRRYMLLQNTVANASAVVFRRSVYLSVGGADETLRLNGDWKLWASMMLAGRVAYIGEPLNFFRFHEATQRSKSLVTGLNVEEMLDVLIHLIGRTAVPKDQLRAVRGFHAHSWMSSLVSAEVPVDRRQRITQKAGALDPHMSARFLWWKLRVRFRRWRERAGLANVQRNIS